MIIRNQQTSTSGLPFQSRARNLVRGLVRPLMKRPQKAQQPTTTVFFFLQMGIETRTPGYIFAKKVNYGTKCGERKRERDKIFFLNDITREKIKRLMARF